MRIERILGLSLAWVTIIGTAVCGLSDARRAHGAIPVSVTFAIDTEGESVTIPFDVRPGEVDRKRRLMIALDVPRGPDLPAVEDVLMNSRSMRVKVFYEDRGVLVPVETADDDTVVARNTGKPIPHSDMSTCNLDLYGTLDDESHIAVCGFYAKRYGHYVAEISTTEPLPAFEGIATTIRVDKFYNTGE